MEKLIELLNEREKELSPSVQVEWTEFSVGINKWYLISKECGFIKWLVDNDKIDFAKSGIDELPKMFGYDYESVECKSDRLIMILSIQDNPLDFLVSILK